MTVLTAPAGGKERSGAEVGAPWWYVRSSFLAIEKLAGAE